MLANKVMLVDDEPRLLAALKRTLISDFTVVTAQSGEQALQLLSVDPDIAVVVSDMQMSNMNGVELLKKVKNRAPAIRRIMLTGNADQQTAIDAVNEGAVMRFLRKPCNRDDLKCALTEAFEDYHFIMTQRASQIQDHHNPEQLAKESFLSMLNHEVRTPLNHIIGLSQIIETPEPSSQQYLEILQSSADKLLKTFSRIAEYSHLSSSQESGRKAVFSIAEMIGVEVANLRPMAEDKNVTIAFDVLGDRSDICLNEEEIRLAFREVLTNAIQYNTPTGHVSVTVTVAEDVLSIRIVDTGIGIPDEALEKVILAFRQSDETTARQYDGLGLGLTLASLIAKLNGGRLEVNTRDGQGTVVVMTFVHEAGIHDPGISVVDSGVKTG